MTDLTHDLTIEEFEQAVEGLTCEDLDHSPLSDLTFDQMAAMTTDELRETLRRAE